MLYEERLDLEQCSSLASSNQAEATNDRYYDDFLSVASSANEEAWKRIPYSLSHGLLTPPSTPEKVSIRSRNNSKGSEQTALPLNITTSHYNSNPTPCSPNNLQVVPDSLPEDAVHDILPWLADIDSNRSMTSPGLFKECLAETATSPAPGHRKSPSMMRHLEAITMHNNGGYQNLVDRTFSMESNRYTESPDRSPYALFQETPIEGQYTPVSGFQSPLQDTRITASMPESTIAPDCMISPVSPSKSLKRAHYSTGMTSMPPRGIVPSSRVARELFPADFPANGQVQMTNRPSHNNNIFHHQLSMDNYRSGEEGDNNGENELSRATHNVLERQRRNDLKMRFHLLRDNIPDVMNNEKAPKIQILKKAYDYVQEMKAQEQRLLADKELERQRKLILLRRLTMLRQGFFNY